MEVFKLMLLSILETGLSFENRSVLMLSLSRKPFPLGINVSFSVMYSGGPLLDSKGNLIGINTAIFTQTGEFSPLYCACLNYLKGRRVATTFFSRLFLIECGCTCLPPNSLHLTLVNSFFLWDTTGTSAGVGFAIPSSTVVKIVPQLIQFGKVCICF